MPPQMSIWRANHDLPGGTEAVPPPRPSFPPVPPKLFYLFTALPRGNSNLRALSPRPCGESQGNEPRKLRQGRVSPARAVSGATTGVSHPTPTGVLFSVFLLKNSIFSCRTGWTRPRKSRSRSGVSGPRGLGAGSVEEEQAGALGHEAGVCRSDPLWEAHSDP